MEFSLTIYCDNAAFSSNPGEVVRILKRLAERISDEGPMREGDSWKLMDVNGNSVGMAKVRN